MNITSTNWATKSNNIMMCNFVFSENKNICLWTMITPKLSWFWWDEYSCLHGQFNFWYTAIYKMKKYEFIKKKFFLIWVKSTILNKIIQGQQNYTKMENLESLCKENHKKTILYRCPTTNRRCWFWIQSVQVVIFITGGWFWIRAYRW